MAGRVPAIHVLSVLKRQPDANLRTMDFNAYDVGFVLNKAGH
jgi:hypothetical protein